MPWTCFMVEPTGTADCALRVYESGSTCPKGHYCQARVPFGQHPCPLTEDGHWSSMDHLAPSDDDSRWPTACDACGTPFGDDRRRQVFSDPTFRAEDGREWSMRLLPPGAMFYAAWHEPFGVGPDGRALALVMPPQRTDGFQPTIWQIDGEASSGGRWTRSGTPPHVTASPSILTPEYHGFLQDGVLTDSLSDRPLPPA